MSAEQTSAPSIVVRGKMSRMPPNISAHPAKISYDCEAPIDDHRTPMGEKLPYGWTNRVRYGKGICSGTALSIP